MRNESYLLPTYAISTRWNGELVNRALTRLERLLYTVSETQVLRPDVYVRRTMKSAGRWA